jgi:hypothetical protein
MYEGLAVGDVEVMDEDERFEVRRTGRSAIDMLADCASGGGLGGPGSCRYTIVSSVC